MATEFDEGFNVDVLTLKDEVGVYGGTDDPWVEAPGAPVPSLYLKTNDDIYKKIGPGDTSGDWELITSGGTTTQGCVPFWLSNGTYEPIPLSLGKLPFWLSNGTYEPIDIVSCP